MKINYYWGFFELEAEDVRDQAWLESFVRNNYKNYENFNFSCEDENGNWYLAKDFIKEDQVVNKIIIGQY